jgi:ribosomal protein S18 acetylase RimI-like enzyme
MNNIEIRRVDAGQIDLAEPLWQKLMMIHRELSPYFSEKFENITWDRRKQGLLEKSKELLLEYAIDSADGSIVGYCISTISTDGETGEIDSLYVDEGCRGSGIGRRLVENAVSWFDSHGVEMQILDVGVGNEQVLDFYSKFDFYPALIILQRKKRASSSEK